MIGSLLLSVALFGGNDPVVLAKALMLAETAYIETNGVVGPFDEEVLERAYTADFIAAYLAVLDAEEARNEPLLDGDPITGRQEYCQLRNLEIEAVAVEPMSAEVAARFQSQWCFDEVSAEVQEAVTEIVFHMVLVDGVWLVADFDHGDYGSFRRLLGELLTQ